MSDRRTTHGRIQHRKGKLKFVEHATHIKLGKQITLSRCESTACGCSKVHCPFCNINNFKPVTPARVRDHLYQTHFKHCLIHKDAGVMMIKCYKQCTAQPGHFHCPYCSRQLLKKTGFFLHLRAHLLFEKKPTSYIEVPDYKYPAKIFYDDIEIDVCTNNCQGSLGKHYHCSLCKEKCFEDMGTLTSHLWRCREMKQLGQSDIATALKSKNVKLSQKHDWNSAVLISSSAVPAIEKFGHECHFSVVRNVGDLPLAACAEPSCCNQEFHCSLCPTNRFKPTVIMNLQAHYLSHWLGRVSFGEYSCLLCYQNCMPQSTLIDGLENIHLYHFHCPKCGITYRRRSTFMSHLELCLESEHWQEIGEVKVELSANDLTISKKKNCKIEVFDKISASLSYDLLSTLDDVETRLDAVVQESGTEWMSSPGKAGRKVFYITGSWDDVTVAKQLLAKNINKQIDPCVYNKQSGMNTVDTACIDVDSKPELLETLSSKINAQCQLVNKDRSKSCKYGSNKQVEIKPTTSSPTAKSPATLPAPLHRYSTRGNKIDFSLLATGRRRDSSEERDSDSGHDASDNEAATEEEGWEEPPGKLPPRLVFSNFAVIPVVVFDLQNEGMSKMLNLDKGDLNDIPPEETKPDCDAHVCPICPFTSHVFLNLVQHCSIVHEIEKSNHCHECPMICADKDVRAIHVQTHIGKMLCTVSKSMRCAFCDFTSDQFADMSAHLISEHNAGHLRCDVCERVFKKSKARDIHLALKHGPRESRGEQHRTKCHICSFDEDDFCALSDHLATEHRVVQLLRCDVCEVELNSSPDLDAHLLGYHGPFNNHLVERNCSECGMLCKSYRSLSHHMAFKHKAVSRKRKSKMQLTCSVCSFETHSKITMRKHKREHTGNKPTLFECELCLKVFSIKRYLLTHMRQHGEKRYSCSQCGKSFHERRSLIPHMESHKSAGERVYRYICPYCGNGYNGKSNYNDHLNKHTGKKPYNCRVCDKSFSFRSQVSQHMVFIHSTLRPHQCTMCTSSFKLASRLKQHMICHTGKSRHTCGTCQQAFMSKRNLRIHEERCPKLRDHVVAVQAATEIHQYDNMVAMETYEVGNDVEAQDNVAGNETVQYLCSVCSIAFEDLKDAEIHVSTAHEDPIDEGRLELGHLTEPSSEVTYVDAMIMDTIIDMGDGKSTVNIVHQTV